ncbi:RidA family protein [Nonomuraea turkmeniaca]|uniref:RidA family protein n=1 Tax=Nonomuraea turkmeniaca TaxID=103838 RepID=UPI001FE66060|nr:RidA family protein [Nonomuraea turkmeniaca]
MSGSPFEPAIGYAHAVVDDDWVHVSGTTGFDYATMTISADVVEQAEQCVRNIEAALAQAGSSLADVVRVRYLLPDRDDFEPCWPVLRRHFASVQPAATMMVCGLADPRMKIEIEVYARRRTTGADDATAEVHATYERYLQAFIEGDLPGIDAVVAYPLAHIGEAEVRMYDAFPIDPADLKRTKAWHTTVNSRFEVVALSPVKAHVVLYRGDRIRKDGSLIETVSGFYAFKRTADGWKLYAISDVLNPAKA